MRTNHKIVLIGSLVLATSILVPFLLVTSSAFLAGSSGTYHQPPSIRQNRGSETPKDWKQVSFWQGIGIKTTEKFQILSNEWRIRWQSKTTAQAGGLAIYVHDERGDILAVAAGVQGDAADTTYLHRAGAFYLSITSAASDYTIIVEEYR